MSSGFSPLYSSHGHGRKTHLTLTDGEGDALCGRQHPFFNQGGEILDIADYLAVDADEVCCKRCAAMTLTAKPGAEGV